MFSIKARLLCEAISSMLKHVKTINAQLAYSMICRAESELIEGRLIKFDETSVCDTFISTKFHDNVMKLF